MELTEENVALLLANVGEGRTAEALKVKFRSLERRNEFITQQRDLLNQDVDAFRTELITASVVTSVARSLCRTGTCEHALNPALWGTLPMEVLQLVFARLPLRQVIRLRVLSKTWDEFVAGTIPGFSKVCAETQPKLFGLLSEGHDDYQPGIMAVRLYDIESKRWHRFTIRTPIYEFIETMHAGDGGLVCIVPQEKNKQKYPLRIVVLNPLTGRWRKLPKLPYGLRLGQPCMVQLVMDRDSKCYKVIVVGPKKAPPGGGLVASIYRSETGKWWGTEATAEYIFGYHYTWCDAREDDAESNPLFVDERGPCAYDCAIGKLVELDDGSSPWKGGPRKTPYALVNDHLFVLHAETYEGDDERHGFGEARQRFCISEYQAQKRQPHWNKLRTHRCNEFEDPPFRVGYRMSLYAGNGFLLVTAGNGERRGIFRHDLAWVYDLSTCQWQTVSGLTRNEVVDRELAMFELQWDAVP